MRMPALIIGAIISPIGLLSVFLTDVLGTCILMALSISWYGWSAEAKLHYMMPIVGTAIYGFGMYLYGHPNVSCPYLIYPGYEL